MSWRMGRTRGRRYGKTKRRRRDEGVAEVVKEEHGK